MESQEKPFANLNEVVNLLARVDRPALAELRLKFPNQSKVLSEGMLMGVSKAASNDKEEAKFVVEVAYEAARAGIEDAARQVSVLRGRIATANNWNLWSQVAAMGFSATTLTLFGINLSAYAPFTVAGSVIGSLCALVVARKLAVIDPSAGSLQAVYLRIVGLHAQLSGLLRQLQIYQRFPPQAAIAYDLGKQVNGLCSTLNEMVAQAP